ncbi:diguanylate cyclase [Thioalkalivibrio sp. ALE12]|uniref:diguanylate cyclase n=1 Tax=Thioalkalivibrio sp. ALE12 TaxID=1158170 RepID=UPI00035D58E4|nr:diguanylate cyclase [Thioalkalivibrio sp. ALE12]
MKILVVDRSRVFRALWSRMVLAAGHKPIMASSGAEGLARIEENDLELVCASITLPDMSGVEFCRRARARAAGHDLPLILLTTQHDHDIRRQAFEAGATDLHDKTNIRDLFHQAARYGRPVEHAHEGNVLYVEDSPTVARVMIRILEGMGLEVAHFRSADEALQAFDRGTWDLVLSDILVEGEISGMGLVSRLRQQFPDKTSLPIVAMSGLDDQNRRAELFRLGVNDFVTKPVLEDEVRARIGNLLANKRLFEEVQDQRQKLYDMAMIDPLTGLRNRNVLAECAARFFAEANQNDIPLSLILLDIDHFKQINDTHGHLIGDEVLVGVGELLRTTGHESDVALRFGGEEFLLVLPECDLFDAHTRAEELRQQLRELEPAGLTITASFGVTSRPAGREVSMNDLFRVADQAVYQAKGEGRDRVVSRTLDGPGKTDLPDTPPDSAPGDGQASPQPVS